MILQGTTGGLSTTPLASGANPNIPAGTRGELLVSEVRGKYAAATLAGMVFTASVSGVTVPANANNLVSVFSLYNAPSSQKLVELVSFDLAYVLATTVVDGYGLYAQSKIGSGVTAPTLMTAGTAYSTLVGGTASPSAAVYSALTHVGTPTLLALMFTSGAVTDTVTGPNHYDFDGRFILPAGNKIPRII